MIRDKFEFTNNCAAGDDQFCSIFGNIVELTSLSCAMFISRTTLPRDRTSKPTCTYAKSANHTQAF